MADITLTAADVAELVGVDVSSEDVVTIAAQLIADSTGLTPAEWADADYGNRPAPMVQQAWAIVAARVQLFTRPGSEGVTAETVEGYSYTLDVGTREANERDPLNGLPRRLLNVATATSTTIRPGQTLLY